MQFTADPSDYFGNRLRVIELELFERLNATRGFDKRVWPTNPDFNIVYPTLVNAAYVRNTNQMCKHNNYNIALKNNYWHNFINL